MSLGDVVRDALTIAGELRAGGLSKDEASKALEQTIRQTWPFTREWHYLCSNCDDLGLEMRTCDGKQGFCGRQREHLPHDYGKPCWCKAGAKFEKRERSQDDAIAAAATTRKMTRAGR